MTGEDRIVAFGPVAGENARILILGSMPSVASLREGFYYGHPRNAFWRILSDIFSQPLPVTIEDKKHLILSRDLALWDVLKSCERSGSLDSAIKNPEPNDFGALFERCPKIERVLLNGGTAHRMFLRAGRAWMNGRQCLAMPSTSPAYTIPYERKLALWREAMVMRDERL